MSSSKRAVAVRGFLSTVAERFGCEPFTRDYYANNDAMRELLKVLLTTTTTERRCSSFLSQMIGRERLQELYPTRKGDDAVARVYAVETAVSVAVGGEDVYVVLDASGQRRTRLYLYPMRKLEPMHCVTCSSHVPLRFMSHGADAIIDNVIVATGHLLSRAPVRNDNATPSKTTYTLVLSRVIHCPRPIERTTFTPAPSTLLVDATVTAMRSDQIQLKRVTKHIQDAMIPHGDNDSDAMDEGEYGRDDDDDDDEHTVAEVIYAVRRRVVEENKEAIRAYVRAGRVGVVATAARALSHGTMWRDREGAPFEQPGVPARGLYLHVWLSDGTRRVFEWQAFARVSIVGRLRARGGQGDGELELLPYATDSGSGDDDDDVFDDVVVATLPGDLAGGASVAKIQRAFYDGVVYRVTKMRVERLGRTLLPRRADPPADLLYASECAFMSDPWKFEEMWGMFLRPARFYASRS